MAQHLGQFKITATGKPPRDVSLVRHCTSSTLLADSEADIVRVDLMKTPTTTTEDKSEFSPVFRLGSCSEKGPKRYMEDEFIAVDILHEHLPLVTHHLPSPGAFYGVRSSDLFIHMRAHYLRY